MIDSVYLQALAAAKMVTTTPAAKGIPVWRERGLTTANLLIGAFVERVRRFATPTVVEQPFLLPADAYEQVFGGYANTYAARVPGLDGSWVLRPDNLHVNVALCQNRAVPDPIIATGGLLRSLRGGASPLFRDRHIWPAVQANQLVDMAEAVATLDRWRQAVEATVMAAGLPVLTVEPAAPSHYANTCLLAVSCLPDGRPTVLATLYVLSDSYRQALGCDNAIIDVGFTGKIIAVAAMQHRDGRGLVLSSAIAPIQVGVVSTTSIDRQIANQWCDTLIGCGIRVTSIEAADRESARWRAEQRFHREAVPLVIGASKHVLVCRMPLRREPIVGLTAVSAIVRELKAHDQRLAKRAATCFDRGLRQSGMLRILCPDCAAIATPPVYGWTHPPDRGSCASCGKAGREALLSEAARFY